MNKPLVTAIVAACNEGAFIEQTVNSLLQQQARGFRQEIVVVDNGSTDSTPEIVARLARSNPRIKLVRLPVRSTPAAFNAGLAAAEGEYVCILGAHAVYPPNYVSTCLAELETHGATGCSGRLITAPADQSLQARLCAWAMAHPFCSSARSVRTQAEGFADTIPFPVMRKQALLEAGGYDEALLRNQDNDMNQRLRALGHKLFLTGRVECLYYARARVAELWRYGYRSGRGNAFSLNRNAASLSLRHLVPLIFVVALLLFATTAVCSSSLVHFSRVAGWTAIGSLGLLGLGLGSHLALGTLAGAQVAWREKHAAALFLPFVILGFHLAYGWGTLAGVRTMSGMTSLLGRTLSALPGASRFRGGFARNVALLSGGTVLAQVLNLAAAPLITRFYAPSEVGQFALFASFLGIACVAVALRYELAIIVAIDEQESAQLVFLSIAFSIPFSLALTLLLYALIRFQILGFGALPGYAAWLMAPALFLTGAFTTLRYWAVRQERFGTISRAAVWQNGARSAVQAFLGFFRPGALGLLVGEVCGRGFGLEGMLRQAFPVVRRQVARSRLADFRRTLKEHRKFPVFSLPSSLIDSVSMNACVPLLALLYGSGVAGHFALVQRVMALPLFLLATNIADVFHSRLALYARETPERCAPLFRRTALGLFLLGIVPAAGLVLLGKPLFILVFGSRWAMAGAMAGLVAPWFLGQFVVNPLSRAVLVLRGQEFKLIYDIFTVLSIGAVFWMAKQYSFSPMRAVIWLSIVNTMAYVAYFLVLIYLVSRVTHSREASPANTVDEALAFSEGQERMAG